jgi:hypothetical protein
MWKEAIRPETASPQATRFEEGCEGTPCKASDHLEQSGGTHATTDAHGHHHVLDAAAPALDQRMTDQAAAGHAIRVTDRDLSAVYVQALVGNAELVAAIDHLHRKGLVQLP